MTYRVVYTRNQQKNGLRGICYKAFLQKLNFDLALINLIWQYFRVPETQFLGTRAERSISVVESGKNAIWGEVSHSLPAKQKYKSMFLLFGTNFE